MRTRSQILEALGKLADDEAIEGFVHDGGMLGIKASDDVIVSIRPGYERRFTWLELDALLEGVEIFQYFE